MSIIKRTNAMATTIAAFSINYAITCINFGEAISIRKLSKSDTPEFSYHPVNLNYRDNPGQNILKLEHLHAGSECPSEEECPYAWTSPIVPPYNFSQACRFIDTPTIEPQKLQETTVSSTAPNSKSDSEVRSINSDSSSSANTQNKQGRRSTSSEADADENSSSNSDSDNPHKRNRRN